MSDVLEHLVKVANEERASLAEQMARGLVADWATYQRLVGSISAIDTMISACTEIQQQMEKE